MSRAADTARKKLTVKQRCDLLKAVDDLSKNGSVRGTVGEKKITSQIGLAQKWRVSAAEVSKLKHMSETEKDKLRAAVKQVDDSRTRVQVRLVEPRRFKLLFCQFWVSFGVCSVFVHMFACLLSQSGFCDAFETTLYQFIVFARSSNVDISPALIKERSSILCEELLSLSIEPLSLIKAGVILTLLERANTLNESIQRCLERITETGLREIMCSSPRCSSSIGVSLF
jgi:hypothetical protein